MLDNKNEEQFDWGCITEDEAEYTIIPQGEFIFTVSEIEKTYFNGSAKLPPCNQAIVTLMVDVNGEEPVPLKVNFFSHKKTFWKAGQFFVSIGLKDKGQPYQIDWNKAIGRKGKAAFVRKKWTGYDGQEREYTEVDKFLPFDPAILVEPEDPDWLNRASMEPLENLPF